MEEVSYGTLDGTADQIVQSTLDEYTRVETHPPAGLQALGTDWAGLSATTERVATAPGQYRTRGGTTTYNAHHQPTASLETGWSDDPTQKRCTLTTYADNDSKLMWEYPATNVVVKGDCNSTDE